MEHSSIDYTNHSTMRKQPVKIYYPSGKQTCSVIRRVAKGHRWERPITDKIGLYCDPTKLSVDIGANIGCHTITMVLNSKYVLAFEPQDHIHKCLQKTIGELVETRNSGDNYVISDYVLGADNGNITFIEDGTGRSRVLTDEFKYKKSLWKQSIKEVRPLDHFTQGMICGLIKIDVEGHEFEVLEGAKKTIMRDKPVIFIEVLDQISKLQEWCKEYDYTMTELSSVGDYLLLPQKSS